MGRGGGGGVLRGNPFLPPGNSLPFIKRLQETVSSPRINSKELQGQGQAATWPGEEKEILIRDPCTMTCFSHLRKGLALITYLPFQKCFFVNHRRQDTGVNKGGKGLVPVEATFPGLCWQYRESEERGFRAAWVVRCSSRAKTRDCAFGRGEAQRGRGSRSVRRRREISRGQIS